MNSVEYWTKRRLLLEKRRKQDGEKLISNLAKEYNQSFQDLAKQIENWHQKYADENGISLLQAKKQLSPREQSKWESDMEDFIKKSGDKRFATELRQRYIQSRVSRLESLQNQIAAQLEILAQSQDIQTFRHLQESYTSSYYETAYDIGRSGMAVRFDILSPSIVEDICRTPWSGKSFSERVWRNNKKLIKEVRSIMAQGATQGFDIKRMSRQLSTRMDVARHRATTLVRTETNFVLNEATASSYESAGLKKYQFLATLDSRTSAICQSLDNKIFDLSEKMVGVNYPPMHPNCRSTTIPYFEDIGSDMRFARDKDGKGIYIPADVNYEQWYNQYIKPYEVPKQPRPKPIEKIKVSQRDQKLLEYENRIVNQDYETAYIVGQRGNVYRIDGDQGAVDISPLHKQLKGSTVTHNHPNSFGEIGGSFSDDDITAYFRYNMKELRAVDSRYRYRLSSNKQYSIREIERLMGEAEDSVMNNLTIAEIGEGFDMKHLVCEALSKNKGIFYSRELRK